MSMKIGETAGKSVEEYLDSVVVSKINDKTDDIAEELQGKIDEIADEKVGELKEKIDHCVKTASMKMLFGQITEKIKEILEEAKSIKGTVQNRIQELFNGLIKELTVKDQPLNEFVDNMRTDILEQLHKNEAQCADGLKSTQDTMKELMQKRMYLTEVKFTEAQEQIGDRLVRSSDQMAEIDRKLKSVEDILQKRLCSEDASIDAILSRKIQLNSEAAEKNAAEIRNVKESQERLFEQQEKMLIDLMRELEEKRAQEAQSQKKIIYILIGCNAAALVGIIALVCMML